MKVTRFEDLEIWQLARELCKYVFKGTSREPFCSDFRFRDQMRAVAGSSMDNIAEGFDRGGNKEFIQFLYVSKSSLLRSTAIFEFVAPKNLSKSPFFTFSIGWKGTIT